MIKRRISQIIDLCHHFFSAHSANRLSTACCHRLNQLSTDLQSQQYLKDGRTISWFVFNRIYLRQATARRCIQYLLKQRTLLRISDSFYKASGVKRLIKVTSLNIYIGRILQYVSHSILLRRLELAFRYNGYSAELASNIRDRSPSICETRSPLF